MPVLKDFRQTKEINLPSYPDSKLVIYSGLLFGDTLGLDSTDQIQFTLELLPRLIKEWNFVDEQEKPLPISVDTLKILEANDVKYLAEQIRLFVDEVKKN